MKRLTASQWLRLQPERRPEPESFPLSSREGGEIIKVAANGAQLRRSA